ncbi:MAG TPA: SUMF1/EgtB/PvdO family nonheme iron enzyme [Thermoanaerobaculia bacterium]|nr:SUMF1/EgtB/PvdO family nonheme iron enzyme [Thermoanaerobaculia bacterium]
MIRRWLLPGLVALGLVVVGVFVPTWLPPLLKFAGTNSATIEGLAGLVQIVVWLGAAAVLLWERWRGRRAAEETQPPQTPAPQEPAPTPPPRPANPPSPQALRSSYLSWLLERHRLVRLPIPDAGTPGSAAETVLPLAGVYTALRTTTPRAELRAAAARGQQETDGLRESPFSALEMLDRQRRLVLLGEPGGGKSTFVAFLVACLAGEALGDQAVNLAALTAPIDTGGGNRKDKPLPQPWQHGALLPVPVVLRDFAARGQLAEGRATAKQVWGFLEAELAACHLGDFFDGLRRELTERGGMVLFDGLDEVPVAGGLRKLVARALADFAGALPACRFLVTSRTYAWRSQGFGLTPFVEAELAPFDPEQIETFLHRWYGQLAALGRLSDAEAKARATELAGVVTTRERLLELGRRPLLLSLMASLHYSRGKLPDDRAQLYRETVDLLLEVWEQRRVTLDAAGRPVVLEPSVAEWLKVDRPKVRQALEKLAFEAHQRQPALAGTADVPEDALAAALLRLSAPASPGGEAANAAELLQYLSERAGILVRKDDGVYTFPHRTLQEYLAARHLTEREFPDGLARRARAQPDRWREVLLLAASSAKGFSQAAVWDLVEALAPDEPPAQGSESAEQAWGAHLAGLAAAESALLEGLEDRHAKKLARLQRWLVHLLGTPHLPARERALAGRSLATLRDPREEVTTLEGMQFCWVPAGKFVMGEGKGHELEIAHGYWLARFPITGDQWRQYVAESGVVVGDKDSLRRASNEPAVWVSWDEAMAFCGWLTERWQGMGLLPAGWAVRLPSEAEWEKAARGGLEVLAEPVVRAAGALVGEPAEVELERNPEPARLYPWGSQVGPELANYDATGIGRPSALGCFAAGRSLYGCEELSGNVWEWTGGLWDRDSKAAEDGRRVLLGGAFALDQRYMRRAFRFGLNPWVRDNFIGFRVLASPFPSDL